jgi:hypothetical protein
MNGESWPAFRDAVLAFFPEASVQRVDLVPLGTDGEEAYELRLVPTISEGDESQARQFLETYGEDLRRLSFEVASLTELKIRRLSLSNPGGGRSLSLHLADATDRPVARGLTPVMTRLDRKDLETLDALIAAGLASSRAEAMRWAVARIRERPAYKELRKKIEEIERLKRDL